MSRTAKHKVWEYTNYNSDSFSFDLIFSFVRDPSIGLLVYLLISVSSSSSSSSQSKDYVIQLQKVKIK